MYFKDLSNQRFGMWLAIEPFEVKKSGTYWLCKCDCGTVKKVHGGNLVAGRSTSCGCQSKIKTTIRNTKHSDSKTRLYHIYSGIKARCFNKNHPAYGGYGGRGITMCEEWKESFEVFRKWSLENGYSGAFSIDRIDVNGDYEPSNCRWASPKQQGNNTRRNLLIQIGNEIKTLSEWCEISNVKYSTAYHRIKNRIDAKEALELSE